MPFPFAVVPKAELCTRTDSARTEDDYGKQIAEKLFSRIHAQFSPGRNDRFSQHFKAAKFLQCEAEINLFASEILLIEPTNYLEIAPVGEKKSASPEIKGKIECTKRV